MKRRIICLALCLLMILTMVALPMNASAAMADRIVKIKRVNVQGARLRSGPSSQYGVLTSIAKNDCVFYLEKNRNSFSYVRSSNGKTGYVYEGFLDSYGACKLSQVYYATGTAKLCDRPSDASNRKATIAKKEHVVVYATKGSWAYVRTLKGKIGYVRLNKLKKAVETR